MINGGRLLQIGDLIGAIALVEQASLQSVGSHRRPLFDTVVKSVRRFVAEWEDGVVRSGQDDAGGGCEMREICP
jgi:hypothetical protein